MTHFIDTLHAKLKQLEATPGKNDKLAIVKTFTREELSVVVWAIDPAYTFYMTTVPEVHPGTGTWSEEEDNLIYALANRKVSGNSAKLAVGKSLSWLKLEHAEVLRRVILKDLKCGVGETLINTAFPGTIFVPPYMRCSLPDKSNMHKWPATVWEAGVISDEKADGMFASHSTLDGEVKLMSRQGSVFPSDALPTLHIRQAQLEGMQLHGELLVYQCGQLLERQVGNGILNSLLQGGELPADHEVRYVVWDVIPLTKAVPGGKVETGAAIRRGILLDLVSNVPGISVIPYRIVQSKDEALAHYFELLGQGKEGTIVKHPDGVWKDTTSKDCVKLKLEVCVELKLVGFTPGSGKNASTFGSARMQSACGLLQVDVPGFTDAQRKSMWERRHELIEKGQVYTVKSNLLLKPSPSNPLHSLFLPRIVEERLDKSVADTLGQIQDQFNNAIAAK